MSATETRQSLASALVAGVVVLVVGWASGLGTLTTGAVAARVDQGAGPDIGSGAPGTAAGPGTASGAAPAAPVTVDTGAAAGGTTGTPPGVEGGAPTGPTPRTPSSSPAPLAPVSASPPTTPPSSTVPVGASGACTSLVEAVLQPFVTHLDAGHLGESPAQQIGDILNVGQYVTTHTALIEAMLQPLFAVLPAVARSIDAFVQHVYHGHLEESPSQQVADILHPDQYVKTHTVLVENMATPLEQTVNGC